MDGSGYAPRVVGAVAGDVAADVGRLQPDVLLLEIGPWAEHVALLDTLRSNPDVTTESSGEGNMRRVTVQPRA